ncbi:protein translocase subunit SecF [Dermacoccus nishinomiyaensis]|uniref:protein translocase subunit SecF n=1 Tax=Dermacoccus nishinomiyaensis TaxID=1274 RepID=UPI000E03C837|nr:protein translocase subunit SecF [Dermacoccus nishinomiyaensis]QQY23482.1 protein translocase subunit SecF [Dermacoccus nishinomiyaensis]STD15538.1 preprotein translocase subunit SecF [Dermacoccus nishinomiyaensis]
MASLATFGNDLFTGRRQIDFIGKRKRWYALTALLLALAAVGLFGRGLNFGLEFTGGSELRVPGVSSTHDYDTRAEKAVQSATGSNADIVVTKLGSDTIRVQSEKLGNGTADATDAVKTSLAKEFGVSPSNVTSSFIGPSWGETVTHKAIVALFVFLAFVSVLLALYFRTWTMAAAALIALLHDLFFTVGIYALTGLEVTPATTIGFLTILGYSIYDTVVVFDKVRENTSEAFATGRRSFDQAANYAVNQTLVRSINTSVVALLPISAILVVGALFIGPSTLLDIAVALFIGIAVGTFSSIFIATPALTDLRRREKGVQELARRAESYQSRATTDDEHATAASASGVVTAPAPSQGGGASQTARTRGIHPAAKRDD